MRNDSESRLEQKDRLRNNLIESDNKKGEDVKRLSPLVFVAAILLVAAFCAACWYLVSRDASLDAELIWQKTPSAQSSEIVETFKGYERFENGLIRYTKDGAEYMDAQGRSVWERSYQLNDPIIDVSGKYAVIADRGGSAIYIFSDAVNTGACSTILPIQKVRVSQVGVVYAVLGDSEAEYITAFRPDGSAIDLSVKSILTGDGFPFDIAVSPDGTQLLTSYVSITGGQIVNNVVFRNFGEVGQNSDARRLVGGFSDEFAGHLAGRVHFSNERYSQAFYDGGVVFFSTRVLNSPEVLARETFEEPISMIAYSDKLAAVLLEQNGAGNRYRLVLYNAQGGKLGETEIEGSCQGMEITGESVLLYDHDGFRVYNKKLRLRADIQPEVGTITRVLGTSRNDEVSVISGETIFRFKY